MKRNRVLRSARPDAPISAGAEVLSEIRGLIESARGRVASFANAELTMLYWRIGERIRREILKEKRAKYGQEIVATLSQQLTKDYGQGFTRYSFSRMIQFAERFESEKIVTTLSTNLMPAAPKVMKGNIQ